MNKLRLYKGIYTLPIHRHSKVRYRQSFYKLWFGWQDNIAYKSHNRELVTDLTIVPKEDNYLLDANDYYRLPYKNYKGDWNETLADMNESVKPLGFWRNLYENKIKKLRRK